MKADEVKKMLEKTDNEKPKVRTILPVYMVAHYGCDERDNLPFFMKTGCCFTANETSQYIMKFESKDEACEARDALNEKLKKEEHPLAGHLHVVQLGIVDLEPLDTEGVNGKE